MKKSSFALAFTAVALSALMLSGCGMFRSTKTWDKAQQESPLEIPPGLDTPSTSAALVIPEPGAGAPASGTGNTPPQAAVSDGFVTAGDVDAVYRHVGETLAAGDLGQVVAHDDTAHTYTVSVARASIENKKGFFGRMFHGKDKDQEAAGNGEQGSTKSTRQVTVTVSQSGSGSEVRAQGDNDAVRKVVDSLKSRMGG
jgi:uncharacterized lipoprotein